MAEKISFTSDKCSKDLVLLYFSYLWLAFPYFLFIFYYYKSNMSILTIIALVLMFFVYLVLILIPFQEINRAIFAKKQRVDDSKISFSTDPRVIGTYLHQYFIAEQDVPFFIKITKIK